MNGDTENISFIKDEDIQFIVDEFYNNETSNIVVQKYTVKNASAGLLGYLSDYWRVKIDVVVNNKNDQLSFFIKSICKSNDSKAHVVRELHLFEQEAQYYVGVKSLRKIVKLKPWCAHLVTTLHEALVFEDLRDRKYSIRDVLKKFDESHTLQTLKTLATFHAATIIFEEKRTEELKRPYKVTEDYDYITQKAGYEETELWFQQNMLGGLEVVKTHSKYANDRELMVKIESQWETFWISVLKLVYDENNADERKVICHRDLWNNNIMFHYKNGNSLEPDDCVLVDFQAIRYQSPVSDVMMFLHINLGREFREQNEVKFLNYYYEQFQMILRDHSIDVNGNIISKDKFLKQSNSYRRWGLLTSACLVPQIYISNEKLTEHFSDTENFERNILINKGDFIKSMIADNDNYKTTVMEVYDEIIERYFLQGLFT